MNQNRRQFMKNSLGLTATGSLLSNISVDRINQPDTPARTIMVKTELIVRESCGNHLKK